MTRLQHLNSASPPPALYSSVRYSVRCQAVLYHSAWVSVSCGCGHAKPTTAVKAKTSASSCRGGDSAAVVAGRGLDSPRSGALSHLHPSRSRSCTLRWPHTMLGVKVLFLRHYGP